MGYAKILDITIPFSQLDVVRYIAFLHNSAFAYPSILSRLSALSFWIRIKDWPLVTQTHAVTQALRGVRSLSVRPSRSRFPITPDVLRHLCSKVDIIGVSSFEVACLKAMFLLAFHAFLRVGELCGSRHTINFGNISFQQTYLSIRFPTYKFSAGRCPSVFIPARAAPLCPVKALQDYVAFRGTIPGRLFLDERGEPYTIPRFRSQLAKVVRAAGLQSCGITPHSFRVGAATTAAALGLPEETIQRMGRWTSRAFFRYIKFQINRV